MKSDSYLGHSEKVLPNANWKALGVFFGLAFVWTWAFLIPAVNFIPENLRIFLIIIAAFGPFISAMVTIRTFEGKEKLKSWLQMIFRFKIPWYLYLAGAFLIPILIGALQYLAYRVLGGVPVPGSADPWYWYLASLIPTMLLTGGNEEPGWRGYALPVLNKLTTPILAGLILGVMHSLWHLPLMADYQTNIFWYAFNLIPLTFLFNWFYQQSRGSVWPVMLFHAGTNVIGSFIPVPMNLAEIWSDFVFLRGVVYWIMAAILIASTWKYWTQKDPVLEVDLAPDKVS